MNTVYNQGSGTVIIVDNSTTGMTGHQDHAATGKTLKGENVPAINIYQFCKAIGIEHVAEVNAFDLPLLEKVIKEENCERRSFRNYYKIPLCTIERECFPRCMRSST